MEHFSIEQTRTAHDALGDAYNTALVCSKLDFLKGLEDYQNASSLLATRLPKDNNNSDSEALEHCAFTGYSARSEAFAYTIFEALAVGTPVVSSDIPGVQWSRAYQNVQFFRTEDPSDCATAITNALGSNDQALNQKIATQVRHDYDIEKWCAQLLSLYRSVGAFR